MRRIETYIIMVTLIAGCDKDPVSLSELAGNYTLETVLDAKTHSGCTILAHRGLLTISAEGTFSIEYEQDVNCGSTSNVQCGLRGVGLVIRTGNSLTLSLRPGTDGWAATVSGSNIDVRSDAFGTLRYGKR